MTLATNPDAMGVVFVFVVTALAGIGAAEWSRWCAKADRVTSTHARGGSEC